MIEKLGRKSSRKPVIGLAGFFGYGNYGDELFVSVFKEYLGDRFALVFLQDLLRKPYFSRPLKDIVAEVDAIVIGGGDIVQPWGIDERYFNFEFLQKPVHIVGVGVPIRAASKQNSQQMERPDAVEQYREYFSHPSVRFIHARDEQSANWIRTKLDPRKQVIEAPDIVCALTLPPAVPPNGDPILGLVTRQRQNKSDDYSRIIALARQSIAKGWKIRHIVLGTGSVGERDHSNAATVTVDKELVRSESLETLTKAIGECSALASMKFHGTVVATMYGVPSIVLMPTNKTRNFMNRIGRGELVSQFNAENLCDKFATLPERIHLRDVAMLRSRARNVMVSLEAEIARSIEVG